MGEIVHLVEYRTAGSDLLPRLAELILAADRPRYPLIGAAGIAWYGGPDYRPFIAGETRRSPTLTRAMLFALEDELKALVTTPRRRR